MATASNNRRATLKYTAQETLKKIPTVLSLRSDAPDSGYTCSQSRYTPLSSRYFPNLSTRVRVIDGDTYDVAIQLMNERAGRGGDTKPVCVLNNANENYPGGGWLSGAMAQEEALCFRSTLSATVKKRLYPIKKREAIYSPTVVIFRESYKNNHRMMDLQRSELLPVVSVISVAAIDRPAVNNRVVPPRYAHREDRELMKAKMRVILRVAVHNKHRNLVLGALGCGVFSNPNNEVADCWIEVLEEQEFRGWWESIVFAVLKNSTKPDNNFDVFYRKLDGLRV